MVQITNLSGISDTPPQILTRSQDKFDRGVITVIDQTKLPRNALKEANNLVLAEDGAPTLRPGVGWYGTVMPNGFAIDGASLFVTSADVSHLVAVAGGNIYRSTNDGTTWDLCTGYTFTVGHKAHFEQGNNFLYVFNGWDNIVRYDGTTTLGVYTALPTPTANVPTKTGLAAATYTYGYRVSAVNNIGYTLASTRQTIQVSTTRDQFNSTNFVTFTWNPVVGAVRYDIYVGQIAGEETYIASVEGENTLTYVDNANAVEQVGIIAPESNTTQGPRVGDMSLIGTRLYATQDRDFPYRLWISGAGRYIGYFSSAYDATYIDLQKGGQYKPMTARDYRDGKGSPLATVWCKSRDGKGCVWQGTLDTFTVGDVTFPVPNFYKLPGSRGTPAPDSVVNVLNDYMYFNQQAVYNLGSRAQFLNLLSTDEATANIRPDIKSVRQSAAGGICSYFDDSKVYFSYPSNSDTNNTTAIFDTERKAWLPKAFTIGFERFIGYTDNTTVQAKKTLCWKPGDNRLSEVSTAIRGDYGLPFRTSLITGLMSVDPKNRFEFMWCEEGEVEFAQPQGQIDIELSAITREQGFIPVATRSIKPPTTYYSWTTRAWTTRPWTYIGTPATSYSEPSPKRYFNVQRDINAYQYRVNTFSLDANYILRTLQINGRPTQAGKPREWELFPT